MAQFSESGNFVTLGTSDGTRIVSLLPGRSPVAAATVGSGDASHALHSHDLVWPTCCTFVGSSALLAIAYASQDGSPTGCSVQLLCMQDDRSVEAIVKILFPRPVLALYASPTTLLAVQRSMVHVLNPATAELRLALSTPDNPLGLGAVACAGSHTWVVVPSSSRSGELAVYDAMTMKIRTIISAHDSPLVAMAVSSSGLYLATASVSGTLVRVFDLRTGRRVASYRRGSSAARITAISFVKWPTGLGTAGRGEEPGASARGNDAEPKGSGDAEGTRNLQGTSASAGSSSSTGDTRPGGASLGVGLVPGAGRSTGVVATNRAQSWPELLAVASDGRTIHVFALPKEMARTSTQVFQGMTASTIARTGDSAHAAGTPSQPTPPLAAATAAKPKERSSPMDALNAARARRASADADAYAAAMEHETGPFVVGARSSGGRSARASESGPGAAREEREEQTGEGIAIGTGLGGRASVASTASGLRPPSRSTRGSDATVEEGAGSGSTSSVSASASLSRVVKGAASMAMRAGGVEGARSVVVCRLGTVETGASHGGADGRGTSGRSSKGKARESRREEKGASAGGGSGGGVLGALSGVLRGLGKSDSESKIGREIVGFDSKVPGVPPRWYTGGLDGGTDLVIAPGMLHLPRSTVCSLALVPDGSYKVQRSDASHGRETASASSQGNSKPSYVLWALSLDGTLRGFKFSAGPEVVNGGGSSSDRGGKDGFQLEAVHFLQRSLRPERAEDMPVVKVAAKSPGAGAAKPETETAGT